MSSDNGKPTIVIFYSSVRPNRQCERVGKFVKNVVETNGMTAIVFDPLEMPFEVVATPLHFMENPDAAPAWLKDANTAIQNADGFIIVSAEYNCSLPPALSNMMDHFSPASYRHRPCGIITYSMGVYGGVRASTLIRPFASELGLITVPTYVGIPSVHTNFDEEGNCQTERISTNIDKLVREVEWYANALRNHKNATPPPS